MPIPSPVTQVYTTNGYKPALMIALSLLGALFAPLIVSENGMAVTLRVNGTASPMALDVTQSVAFGCSPQNGKTPYTYSWTFGDGGTSTLQNPSHAYNATGAYVASVTVIDRNLATGSWTSGTITVNALPGVNGTATPTLIDATQSVSFTSTPRNGTTPYAFVWDFGDGSPVSLLQNPNHVYSAAGVFAASLTLTDAAGKTAFWVVAISVNTPPSVTGAATPTTIDATQGVTFSCTATNGTPPYTYSWTFGDGGTSALQNPFYLYNAAGTYTASVSVTDGVGKTVTWSSDMITVNALPGVTGMATPSVIDLGQVISFTCSPTNGTIPYTYYWTFGDGGTSTLQNPSHAYVAVGLHSARVILTDAFGKQATWSKVITVNNLPGVTGTATPTTIDATQSVSFTCSPRNGTSPYSFLWNFGDGSPTSAAQNPTHTYAIEGLYTANVTATDAVGERAYWSVAITVNAMSSVTGTATPRTVDVTQTVSFTSTPHYGTPPYSYFWVFGDGGTSTQRNPSHVYNTPGIYTANVTVTDSVAANASWTVVITVHPLPSVTGTCAPTIIDSGQIVSFTTTPGNGTPPYTYLWDFGGAPGRFVYGTTNQSQSPFFEYENPGSLPDSYTATVTVTDAIGGQSSWTSSTITVYALPSVTGAASPTIIDAGNIVSFSCTARFGSGVYPSYRWAFGDDPANISTSRNTTHEYDAPGFYTATVTVTDSLGAQAIWMVDVTVNPLPMVIGTASPRMIDATQRVAFNCTPGQGTGPYSFLWAFGDNPANTSTARNVTHQYDAAGSYIVMITVTDSLGEQANWTVDITVNPEPSVTGSSSATTIDIGQSVTFTSAASYGTTPYTYNWAFGDGGTSSLQNPSYVYAAAGSHLCNVTVVDAVGGQASWTITIVVNALPIVSGTVTPAATDVGLPVSFACAASLGTGPYTYRWNFGDGSPQSAAKNSSHVYAVAGSYAANVTATDALGEMAVWTVAMTVSPLPIVAGTAAPGTIDATQNVSFACAPSFGTPPYSYLWTFGDGGTSNVQNPSHEYAVNGTYAVNVTVTDSVGQNASWSVVVTVNDLPSVAGTAVPSTIDPGRDVSFTCTASGGTAPYTYRWSFGDGSTSAAHSPSHKYTSSGTYAVSVTVTDAANGVARWSTVIVVNNTSGISLATLLPVTGAIGGVLAILLLLFLLGRWRRDDDDEQPAVEEAVVAPMTMSEAVPESPAPAEDLPVMHAETVNEPVIEEPVALPPPPPPEEPPPATVVASPAAEAGTIVEVRRKIMKNGSKSTGKTCPLCLESNDASATECKRCRTKLK